MGPTKSALVVLSVLIICLQKEVVGLTEEQISQIDALIEDIVMPANLCPGFGISIVENGEVAYSRGYGLRNVSAGLEMEDNSLFAVGSISKGITATLVVKVLHEKFPEMGENVLNVPVNQLIPTYNVTFSDRMRTETVSFRDLLSHRACLNSMDVHSLFGIDEPKDNLIFRLRYLERACDFRGGGLAYNNAMITLAGELVAHISNTTYDNLLAEFFQQVNMTDSTVFDKKGKYEALSNWAHPYVKVGSVVVDYNPENLRTIAEGNAAGGILSSPRDMGKYIRLHINRGRVGDQQVIPEDVIGWVLKNAIQMDFGFKGDSDEHWQTNYGYALSYWLGVIDGFSMINHGGYYPPYNSQITWLPGKKAGIFTTSNGPGALSSQYNHMFIHNTLGATLLFGESPTKLDIDRAAKQAQNHKVEPDYVFTNELQHPRPESSQGRFWEHREALQVDDLVGVYGHPYLGDVHISYDNETSELRFQYGILGIGPLELLPDSADTYKIDWETDIVQYAHSSNNGGPVGDASVVFKADGALEFYSFAGGYRFMKDATLDTYPIIPWDPDSCV